MTYFSAGLILSVWEHREEPHDKPLIPGIA